MSNYYINFKIASNKEQEYTLRKGEISEFSFWVSASKFCMCFMYQVFLTLFKIGDKKGQPLPYQFLYHSYQLELALITLWLYCFLLDYCKILRTYLVTSSSYCDFDLRPPLKKNLIFLDKSNFLPELPNFSQMTTPIV